MGMLTQRSFNADEHSPACGLRCRLPNSEASCPSTEHYWQNRGYEYRYIEGFVYHSNVSKGIVNEILY
jgi:hypothetical protein